jgi:predicted RND superfamily exporter protein
VLVIAAVAGVAGLALTPLQRTTSDLRDFVSPGLPALHDLDSLERATGAAGEVDVLVGSSTNVAAPQVVSWMLGAERRLQALLPKDASPPVSLADLLITINRGTPPDAQATNQILQTVPAYLLQGLVTRDASRASMSMGIPLQPLHDQEALIQRMRAALQPPPGVTARLAGTAVLAADGEGDLARTGLIVDLLALGAVAVVLLVTTLSGWRVLVALVPMVLATGWTTLAVVALRIQITPITAVLGALVVALATEFSVIWSARFREARRDGLGAEEAAALTSARTGSAIAVSGLTLCAGFLALAAGSSPLLRSFGLVAGCGVVAAVAAVLLLCPPLCVRLIHVQPAPRPQPEPPPPVGWSPMPAPAADHDG